MKHWYIILPLLLVVALNTLAQNTYDCEIALLETGETTNLFSVKVEVDKKADIEKCACEALLATILTKGVDGINNGRPASSKEIKYWRNENRLFQSEDNYLKYVSYQLESEPVETASKKTSGSVYVMLNREQLLRYLERYGVLAK